MKMTLIKLISVLLSVVTILSAQNRIYDFGWHEETIEHDDLTRHYRFYIPRVLPQNPPMVILLHGGSQSMNKIFETNAGGSKEWLELAEAEKFVLMVPNGVNIQTGITGGNNQYWNDCRKFIEGMKPLSNADDVGFINKLMEWSKENIGIDKNRIYATGASNGGMMTFRLAREFGDKLAAVAVFIANMPKDSECGLPVRPIPIMIVNGTDDPLMPYNGGSIIGNRGAVLSAEETLNYWVSLNHLNTQKRTNRYYEDFNTDDGSIIIKNEFNRPLTNPPVEFYVISGGGHSMPSIKHSIPGLLEATILGKQNRDLEGALEAWKFLRRFSLNN